MNKIYALKYCYITNTVKVVSELARRVCKGSTRRGKRLSVLTAYSALFDHGLASKSDQRFASIRSTGNLTFSTAF
ncbi:hypothetical protein FCY48_05275 [Escherichia coli]|nr:hypothetical protein [Escherichia coli]